MKRKNIVDSTADSLLKRKEKFDNLSKFSSKAIGLASFLSNKPKSEVLLKEAEIKLPELKKKLLDRLEFFDRKTIKSDNIRVLNKELTQCNEYISKLREEDKTEDIKIILDWYYKISEKYGF
jgi:hypothetical protein